MAVTVAAVDGFLGEFLKHRTRDLARIARQSRGRAEVGDLISEAWLFVMEQELKRGIPLDPASVQDQELLLGFLYNKHINFVNPVSRFGISLDQVLEDAGGDELPALMDRQRAPESCEPLQYLLGLDEDIPDPFAVVAASYSQAAAYLILLERFAWSAIGLAELFCISVRALLVRLCQAGEVLRVQPSLFDGIERVSRDFQPAPRRRLPGRRAGQGPEGQAWLPGLEGMPT